MSQASEQQQTKFKYSIVQFDSLEMNYWAVPKCGATMIKTGLFRLDQPERYLKRSPTQEDPSSRWIHTVGVCHYITADEAANNGYRNIAIIRHPLNRFVSGYKDFFLKRPNEGFGTSDPFDVAVRKIRKSPDPLELAKLIADTPDLERNLHYRSQTSFLLNMDIELFRLEQITTRRTDIHPELDVSSVIHTTEGYGDVHVSDELIDLVEQIYNEDYGLWRHIS